MMEEQNKVWIILKLLYNPTRHQLTREEKKKEMSNNNKLITNPLRSDSWCPYLVIKRDGDESFKAVSPFAINKSLTQTVGPLKNVRKL